MCSRDVDLRRTECMIEKEEDSQQHFQDLKDALQQQGHRLALRQWKKDFKFYIDKFIWERIQEKCFVTLMPCEDEEGEEQERNNLHGLQRLVAGAVQEWELVQQPKHAALCAELDGALVWQGRG